MTSVLICPCVYLSSVLIYSCPSILCPLLFPLSTYTQQFLHTFPVCCCNTVCSSTCVFTEEPCVCVFPFRVQWSWVRARFVRQQQRTAAACRGWRVSPVHKYVYIHTAHPDWSKNAKFYLESFSLRPTTGDSGPCGLYQLWALMHSFIHSFIQMPDVDGVNNSALAHGVSMETNLRKSYPSVRHVNGVINRSFKILIISEMIFSNQMIFTC